MTRSFDVRLDEEPYNFGARGGLKLGKSLTSPSPAMQVGTIEIPSFHHGPGQVWGRDPEQYLHGTKVDTSRPGLLLPAGAVNLRHDGSTADFDGLHTANFCQVNNKVFLITPNRILEMNHGSNTWASVKTPAANVRLTGSFVRWRGKVIFGTEKAPVAALGGDGSDRYAESSPVVYDIATNAFSEALTSAYFTSHLASAKGAVWWIQNRGRFAAPRLFWSDDTETDFGSFAGARIYGPFDLEMGGYCTSLYMAGPHILIFKRDGSIVGVDESKLWTTYTAERGQIGDDLFGHGVQQFLDALVFQGDQGALAFNPANLGLDSIEPSIIQPYMGRADKHVMGRVTAFTVRNQELYAFGRCNAGTVMYQGGRYGQDGFRYSSDYGMYATPTVASSASAGVFRLRQAAGGSALRSAAGSFTLRKPAAGETFDEIPRAATIYRHTGPEHHHIFVAHQVEATSKLRIYQIDLPDPAWQFGPAELAQGELWTSRITGQVKGVSQLPLQIRGYAAFSTDSALSGTSDEPAAPSPFSASIAVEEGQFALAGSVDHSGMFVLPMPEGVKGVPGRFFRGYLQTPDNAEFRLEMPLYLDVMYARDSVGTADHVTIAVTVGDQLDNIGGAVLRESPRNAVERLLALENSRISLEFHWGSVWSIFVEKVEAQQADAEHSEQVDPGQYIVTLECRRL